jgi:hypothetical protein
MKVSDIIRTLNKLGGKHGIGIVDIVENRVVGMKSRGVYETPGGTVLIAAHRAVESITLDREAAHLKDDLMHLKLNELAQLHQCKNAPYLYFEMLESGQRYLVYQLPKHNHLMEVGLYGQSYVLKQSYSEYIDTASIQF